MKHLKHAFALIALAAAASGCCCNPFALLPLCAPQSPQGAAPFTVPSTDHMPTTELLMPVAATRSALPQIQRY